MFDILGSCLETHRLQLLANPDPRFEFRPGSNSAGQFGLAEQYREQVVLALCIDVGERSDSFEGSVVKLLSFVEQDGESSAGPNHVLEQCLLQCGQS